MESERSYRWISYIFLLAAFFLTLLALDKVFDLQYIPTEHKPVTESPTQNIPGNYDAEVIPTQTDVDTLTEMEDNPQIIKEESPAEVREVDDQVRDGSSTEYFEALKKKYQSAILDSLPRKRPRRDIIVRYYHHKPDGNSAYALGKLRYYIHERPVDPAFDDYQSNAIFYGDAVSLSDIQLVAYTLLSEGLPIKTIKPSLFHNTWKAHAIEIGTDTTLLNTPTLTLEDLRNLSL